MFSWLEFPFNKKFLLSLTLHCIAHNALQTPRRAPSVTLDVLYHIFKVLDFENDPLSCTLFCAFLLTLFLMAGLANIVPPFRQCFNPSRHLILGDVATNQHGLIVTFKCTKTIQFGERKLHVPLLRLPGSHLCPVSTYHRMIRLVPASSWSALFVSPSHYVPISSLRFVLSPSSVRRFLLLVSQTLRSFEVILSFRGAASWAFNHGLLGELIQIYGD